LQTHHGRIRPWLAGEPYKEPSHTLGFFETLVLTLSLLRNPIWNLHDHSTAWLQSKTGCEQRYADSGVSVVRCPYMIAHADVQSQVAPTAGHPGRALVRHRPLRIRMVGDMFPRRSSKMLIKIAQDWIQRRYPLDSKLETFCIGIDAERER
jgi:hypothetical protein